MTLSKARKECFCMNNMEKLKNLIEKNNGILLSREVKKHNIHLQYLKQLESAGYVKKVERGVYLKKDKEINEFFLLGEKYKSGIFSHNTALYFYDLTDRTPLKFDMTFSENVTIHDNTIKVHYTREKLHEIGLRNMELRDGTTIRIYDIERTICDIIKARNKIDPQILNTAIQEYFKRRDNDYILLMKYARIFRIEKILRNYMEVI